MKKLGLVVALGLGLAGCVEDGMDGAAGQNGTPGQDGTDGSDGTNGTNGTDGTPGPAGPQLPTPGVYTLSNAAGPNQVAAYVRATNGNLSRKGRFDTGGAGLGAGLGSQGALVFDTKLQRFFAVNTGDDSISMLELDTDGSLKTLSTVPSGGVRPVSITVHDGVVYVANQGDITATAVNATISGFRVEGNDLVGIAGSIQNLSATTDVHPTDIAFSPDGGAVVVAERFANKLDTFKLVAGVAQPGSFQASAGMQPFAFDWSPEGFLVVAEVGPGTPNGSSVSSYALGADGALTPVTSHLATGQTAACWLAVAGGYAYVANAASANLTGITIAEDGVLSLHDASGITATTAAGSTDLAVTPDRGFLYALAGNPKSIYIFAITADGGLTPMSSLAMTLPSVTGLVAR
ncbi:MAG: beta-propeller fold lactonase family protein [Deltaproteobacteria bacterium]|nr:beta-propeller fold lactonase family protein [Deltaproteobacteria bacterium]